MKTRISAWLEPYDLLRNLVWAELTARYKTALLGTLWFVINPLLMMVMLIVVFRRVIHLDIQNYPVFVLSALLPWTFFSMALTNATGSLARSASLVKRVRIPRAYVPCSAIGASLIHFLISLSILFLVMLFSASRFSFLILLLPLIICLQVMFLTGASLLTSSLNVFYRDVEHVLGPLIQALFYLTPSFYPLSYVPKRWLGWYLLNPMAGIIEIYRDALTLGMLPARAVLGMAVLTSAITLAAGVVVFRRLEPYFDDYI
ncbi:MAG: ABC transporter permease [Candidatus Binatales bacterium]